MPGSAAPMYSIVVPTYNRPHLLKLLLEILQVEALALLDLAGELLGLGPVDFLLDVFDQRQHVAHAEDARGDAIRVKR